MTRNERKILNTLPTLQKLIDANVTLEDLATYYQLKARVLKLAVLTLRTHGFKVPTLPESRWSTKEGRSVRLDKAWTMRHNGKTFDEIGVILGVTRQRAYQLYNEAKASRQNI